MIYDTIQSDIIEAMKSRNNTKRDCLRSIVSEIKNQTVNAGKEITEDICLKVVQKSVKTHMDSIEQFKSAGRNDLVAKEDEELSYISKYLPKMKSQDETIAIINDIIKTNNLDMTKKSMGIIMKNLPKDVDKKIASAYINSILH